MYTPDWHFVRKLKAYDERLSVKWMSRLERWGIYRSIPRMGRLYRVPVLVMTVQGADKSYRSLDNRVLKSLAMGDLQRRGNAVIEDAIMSQKKAELAQRDNHRSDMEALADDVLPRSGYEDNTSIGSRNVPKEDVQSVEEYTEEREILDEMDRQELMSA
tara:strand:- start:508 stop:984 length:477 start_codon:yes stop_codon:yes gene_type:complete